MSDKKRQFLDTMKMIESSGGKNFDHEELQSGMHKGHRAIGSYGFMPQTVQEMVRRMSRSGQPVSEDLNKVAQMDPLEMKEYMESNLDLEEELAEYMAGFVLDRYQDPEKAAWAWEHGHNTPKDRFDTNNYQESDRIRKYRKYAAPQSPSREPNALSEMLAKKPEPEAGHPIVGATANPYTKTKEEEYEDDIGLPTEENTPSRFRKLRDILGQPT